MGMKTGPLGHQVFFNIDVDGTCHMSADKEQGSHKEEGEQRPSLFQHKLALTSSPMKSYKSGKDRLSIDSDGLSHCAVMNFQGFI